MNGKGNENSGPGLASDQFYYKGKMIRKGVSGEVNIVFWARDGLVFAANIPPNKRKRDEEIPAGLTKIRR
jgi:hypothetical protein